MSEHVNVVSGGESVDRVSQKQPPEDLKKLSVDSAKTNLPEMNSDDEESIVTIGEIGVDEYFDDVFCGKRLYKETTISDKKAEGTSSLGDGTVNSNSDVNQTLGVVVPQENDGSVVAAKSEVVISPRECSKCTTNTCSRRFRSYRNRYGIGFLCFSCAENSRCC